MNITSLKFFVSFAIVLLFRLVRGLFTLPGLEPVMTTTIPFAKEGGKVAGFLFAAFSIAIFDVVTGTAGWGTVVNATTYGIVGVAAASWFQRHEFSRTNTVGFAIVGTLFYDLITGVIATPLLYPISFGQAAVGQIPFTLWHLAGNVAFVTLVSPLIHRCILANPRFSWGREVAHA
ncbi:MAG: hypothetical protein RLY57_524 [Candidatus Parcubacteria bacterium]|jgi:uncharacterized membrane protein